MRIRGTCVAIDGLGVLLRGGSGAGKSDLALRLIDGGALLVADDYTEVTAAAGVPTATAPATIRGMLEVRGLGILTFPAAPPTPLVVIIDLVEGDRVPRLPEAETEEIVGVALPRYRLDPFQTSAPAKVRLVVRLTTNGIMRTP